MLTAEQIITELNRHANAEAVEGMARFGIRSVHALGISLPTLRKAEAISKMDSKTAQWVAKDALRELNAKSPTT